MRRFNHLWCATLLLVSLAGILPAGAEDLAVVDVGLYAAPGAARLDGATVIIRDGHVAEVGIGLDTGRLPVLNGGGRVATAGLWNCHVHLTDPALREDAAAVLRDMLLSYGFTSVVDTGSELSATQHLQTEIEAGRLDGPRIVTANGSLVYTDGTPSYLPGIRLPEVATPAEATPAVNRFLDAGADGIKIFSGSFQSPGETVLLPPAVIRAITETAHARGSFVIAHPTDRPGLVNAVSNGVDVLAHTAPPAGALGPDLTAAMVDARVGLIPTLKLWAWELGRAAVPPPAIAAFQGAGVDQLREFAAAGGEVLFGTDVGYMRDYDTAEEVEMMQRAGMTFHDILAALTTNPAQRFAGESGRVEPGSPGDLVVFMGDPAADPAAFARVSHTIRGGRVVHGPAR